MANALREPRAYNGGLGESAQRGPGESPWSEGQGEKPPEDIYFFHVQRRAKFFQDFSVFETGRTKQVFNVQTVLACISDSIPA